MNLYDWSSEAQDCQPSVVAHDPARNRWDFVIEPIDEPAEGSSIDDLPVEIIVWVTFSSGEFTISTWNREFAEIFTDVRLAGCAITEKGNALTRWGIR